MASPHAQIQGGIVVNILLLNAATDYLDPTFTWIDVTGLTCNDGTNIQIGCTYDGTNFISIPPVIPPLAVAITN